MGMETRVPPPRRIVLTRSGDHDRCNVLVILNGISRREARRNTHVVELPAAHVVEVNAHHAVFMLLQIGSLNHNIIPADVRSGHIVYHLFTVFGVGIIGDCSTPGASVDSVC